MFIITISSCIGQSIKKTVPRSLCQDKIKELLFSDTLEKSTTIVGAFKLTDGTELERSNDKSFYYLQMRHPEHPYRTNYMFFKKSLQLKAENYYFYDAIVSQKIYNEQGKLIYKKNFNTDYAFSIQNLIDKMQTEYQIDLLHPGKVLYINVERGFDTVKVHPFSRYYLISISTTTTRDSGIRKILLDGNSGKVISDGMSRILTD